MDVVAPRAAVSVDQVAAARLARECPIAGQAGALALWVGRDGRPVTASQVLRRVDVAPAGTVLGVAVPAGPRTAADVPVLHRPWSFAVGTGLLAIDNGTAVTGPLHERWSSLEDAEVLDAWLAGLQAVCEAEADARSRQSVAGLVFAFLEAVAAGDCPDPQQRWSQVIEVVEHREDDGDRTARMAYGGLTRYLDPTTRDPFAGLVALLGQLGAVTGQNSATVAVTALGRWVVAITLAARPRTITADQSPAEVVELLADCVRQGTDPWPAVRRWLAPRPPLDAALALLSAAAGVSAAARIGAGDVVDGLGEPALAAWRAVEDVTHLGPHARATLAAWDERERVAAPADARWLAVEHAVATLEGPGPDEALTAVVDHIPGEDLASRLVAVAATGHPDAGRLAAALADFVASGATRSIDQVYQLKVGLMRCRPPIWRRVLVPATTTLDDLHVVIQVLFGWDGDHLHLFEVGAARYSDPMFDLRDLEMDDESRVRLRTVFTAATKKIRYEYDFGASWWHEITLEQVREGEPGTVYPRCTGFAGDCPVEYWSEDAPQDPQPFDLAATNRCLAGLANLDGEQR